MRAKLASPRRSQGTPGGQRHFAPPLHEIALEEKVRPTKPRFSIDPLLTAPNPSLHRRTTSFGVPLESRLTDAAAGPKETRECRFAGQNRNLSLRREIAKQLKPSQLSERQEYPTRQCARPIAALIVFRRSSMFVSYIVAVFLSALFYLCNF